MDTLEFCNLPEEELKSVLRSRMNEHRYAHSLNVAERAVFLAKKYGADIKIIDVAPIEISSSELRSDKEDGMKKYLPDKVYDYIKEHGLYEDQR